MLDKLNRGEEIKANFIEGIGLYRRLCRWHQNQYRRDAGRDNVNDFAEESFILTPFDNQNIIKILGQLNVESLDQMTDNEELAKLLTRE